MNDANDSQSGSATDTASIIDRYIAGSDSERDVIAADHPELITDAITQRAAQARPGPRRTWTEIGIRYTAPERRPDVLRAIASLEWQAIGGEDSVQAPAAPGLAINSVIREMRMPRVDQIAWHGSASAVDWYDEDKVEGEHYAIYGIQGNYRNGRVRVYVIDVGTEVVPLASDFCPAPAPDDTAAAGRQAEGDE